jgi:hypothetical protein
MVTQQNPEILYKYRSLNKNTFRVLQKGEIFLSSVFDFNDPFEGFIPLAYKPDLLTDDNIFTKLFEVIKKANPDWDDKDVLNQVKIQKEKRPWNDPDFLKQHRIETRKKIGEDFGVFCLTPQNNNFLMWSHYADSHKGICIGFDTHILMATVLGFLQNVNYQCELPKFELNEDVNGFLTKFLFTKSDAWQYENEYRLIKFNAAKKHFFMPINGIREVILGCSMEANLKQKTIDLIKCKLPDTSIYDSYLSSTNFEVLTRKIL